MPHTELSVHPHVLAALREDARAAVTASEDSGTPPPVVAAWLVGLSLRDREANASTVRVVGVVRCSRSSPSSASSASRPLAEDLAATTAMLPGGVSVVGAATFPLASSPPPSQSLRSHADAAAAAAKAAGGASAAEVAVAVAGSNGGEGEGSVLWLVGGEERQVAVDADEETSSTTSSTAAPATPPASPAVAALSAARALDPWILLNFSAVRCGPLEVSGGARGARAALAELCGDGDDPGDAVFVATSALPPGDAGSGGSAPILLAGNGPAPEISASSPLLVAPHSSPPPPPQLRSRLSATTTVGPPPAPTAVFEPLRRRELNEGEASPLAAPPPKSRLILDAIAFYPKTATAGEAAAALRVALSRQLRAAMTMTTTTAARINCPPPLSLRASAFLLPGLPIYITPLLPFKSPRGKKNKKKGDSSASAPAPAAAAAAAAAAARAALGESLRVPAGLPLLRPSAAAPLLSSSPCSSSTKKTSRDKKKSVDSRSKLLDVHLRLPCYSLASKPKSSSSSISSSSLSSSPLLSFTPPLPPSPTLSCATVAGSYRYFHYGQDGCDDRGWGCAYRSLQTLWSWFADNHFFGFSDDDGEDDDDNAENKNDDGNNKKKKKKKVSPPFEPPSHAEIQRALVSLGDKPPSFLGSSSWIGAMEIGYVLDSLAGVECKVLTVPSGGAMASSSAAGALVSHFRNQGTPAMIGGGVLAYTCLGAAFDSETGEASFLILDPHYCGVSDNRDENSSSATATTTAAAATAAVVKGGWVAWKKPGDSAAAGGPLFVDDAFYNILLPQRPRDAV